MSYDAHHALDRSLAKMRADGLDPSIVREGGGDRAIGANSATGDAPRCRRWPRLLGTLLGAAILVAAPLVLLVCLGWYTDDHADDNSELALEVEAQGGRLRFAVSVPRAAQVTLLGGTPWSPTRDRDPMRPGLRILVDPQEPPIVLLAGRAPAGEALSFELSPTYLASCPNPCALQCVATPEDGTKELLISTAWVVSHANDLRVAPFSRELLRGQIGSLALWAWLPAVLLAVVMMSRWPRHWPRWAGLALLLTAILAVVLRRGAASDSRELIERGFLPPPLTWPDSWPMTEDRWTALFGPAITELSTAARGAREGSEALTIWTADSDGPDFLLSMALAQLLPEARLRRRTADTQPRGLVILVGGEPMGEVLWATPRGSVARVGL